MYEDLKKKNDDSRFIKQRVQAGGGSIGIWGCMSMKGTGCRKVYSGRMEQNLYMDTLDNELIPELLVDSDKPWLFQQDNAPCHKSKKYFNKSDIRVMPWPSRSPDLNPIERLWNIIDKKAQ